MLSSRHPGKKSLGSGGPPQRYPQQVRLLAAMLAQWHLLPVSAVWGVLMNRFDVGAMMRTACVSLVRNAPSIVVWWLNSVEHHLRRWENSCRVVKTSVANEIFSFLLKTYSRCHVMVCFFKSSISPRSAVFRHLPVHKLLNLKLFPLFFLFSVPTPSFLFSQRPALFASVCFTHHHLGKGIKDLLWIKSQPRTAVWQFP